MNPFFSGLLEGSVDWFSSKKLPLIILLIGALLYAVYLIGYLSGSQPREVVCKEDIERVRVLKDTAQSLQSTRHAHVLNAQQECVKREQSLCDDRVSSVKERIKELRCKICEVQQ